MANESSKAESSSYSLLIDNKKYTWQKHFITGLQIKQLAKLPEDSQLFLKVRGQQEDQLIQNETMVDITNPGIERFYVSVNVVLIVNGREKPWREWQITFQQLVQLAFPTHVENPNTVFTVVYKNGPPQNTEGTMTRGDRVYVKNKMIFNVTATDKS